MQSRRALSLLLCLVCSSAALATPDLVSKHLRKFEKKDEHRFRLGEIDFIYVINLKKRPEKLKHTLDELRPYGIEPFRFEAVNGWELSQEVVDDVGVILAEGMSTNMMGNYFPHDNNGKNKEEPLSVLGRTYYAHGMSRGAIGINLSHLSILQDAYDSGYRRIWVMEDDIEVKRHPNLLSQMVTKLDALVGQEGWDVLFTDQDTKDRQGNYVICASYALKPNFTPADPHAAALRYDISADFKRVGARYGAYSMVVNRVGMKKILDFIKATKIFLPYDMEFTLPPGINLFSVREDVVSTQAQALSDNGGPFYDMKAKKPKDEL